MKEFKFSQRTGKTPIKNIVQIDSIDSCLKNQLWNTIFDNFQIHDGSEYSLHILRDCIWVIFFEQAKDMVPNVGYYKFVRDWFFESAKWYEIYDFIEYICSLPLRSDYNRFPGEIQDKTNSQWKFPYLLNQILEQELSGYRLIDNKVVPIISDIETESISTALLNTDKHKSVKQHLKTAIAYLSDKQNPDYRNCIKEAISAVEAYCKIITNNNKAMLGDTLKEIEKKFTIHPALKEAFNKIYGYTSDASGIRHALTENGTNTMQEDAIFMLVACSAFINYLKSKTK